MGGRSPSELPGASSLRAGGEQKSKSRLHWTASAERVSDGGCDIGETRVKRASPYQTDPGPLASAWLGFVYNVQKELSLRAQQLLSRSLCACVAATHVPTRLQVRLGAGGHWQVLLTEEPGGHSSACQPSQLAGPQSNWALTALAGALRMLGFLQSAGACAITAQPAQPIASKTAAVQPRRFFPLRPIRRLSIIALVGLTCMSARHGSTGWHHSIE